MHRRLLPLAIVAALVTVAGVASAAQLRGSDTATLKASFATEYSSVPCVGAPTAHHCVPTTGSALVPGLGSVTEEYVYAVFAPPGEKCDSVGKSWPFTTTTNVLTVAGKGQIHLTLTNAAVVDASGCSTPSGGPNTFPLSFTVTGGTGKFAGASGSGTFEKSWGGSLPKGKDAIVGTITAPGHSFDLAAPTISGATAKTVVARKGVKRVRVVTQGQRTGCSRWPSRHELLPEIGQPRPARTNAGPLHRHGLEREHRAGAVHDHGQAGAVACHGERARHVAGPLRALPATVPRSPSSPSARIGAR